MVTVILPVSTSGGFENLKRVLLSLESDLDISMSILAIVSDKDLYIPIRNYLNENIDFTETLTVYTERKHPIKEALFQVGESDYVFIWNEKVILPNNTISRLLKDYSELPNAGFIMGHFMEYPLNYWVDDVYSDSPKCMLSSDRELRGLTEIDLGWCFGLMTKTITFKDYFFRSISGTSNGVAYGLTLRRKGFRNFVDRNIELRYGGNNENHNAKRTSELGKNLVGK